MKKQDLPNCPQWLLDSDTSDEDIGWDLGGRIAWNSGVWHGGDWRGGVWHWGVWHDGLWHDGIWHGGSWHGGEWHGGASAPRSCYRPLLNANAKIRVGCKLKTAKGWIRWLNGTEEFSTKRGTPEFAQIRAHILATITYQKELEAYQCTPTMAK